METTTISFMYLVKITVGAKTERFIVKNHVKVPDTLIKTMAEDKIEAELSRLHNKLGSQYEEKAINKLRKTSTIEISDLNEVDIYELSLNFDKNERPENQFRESAEA